MEEILLPEITFDLPKLSVWDIIICSDKSRKEYKSADIFQLCIESLPKSASASEIIEHLSPILLENHFFDEIGDLSFDETSFSCSTLKANLYCVLLLEAMGQTFPNVKPTQLKDLMDDRLQSLDEESVDHLDYKEISKMLSNRFPAILKELFVIPEKESHGKYQIQTRYPDLLLTMLRFCRGMPLVDSKCTSYSFKYGSKFYRNCIYSIGQCGWNEVSLAQYYFFERLFRLNTKITLFKAEYDCREKKKSVSPHLLANCLFPLPLVLFPRNNLTDLLYGDWNEDEESIIPKISLEISSRQSLALSFLIHLSFNFYDILYVLRKIIHERKYYSSDEITLFFFPEGKNAAERFVKSMKPENALTLEAPYYNQKVRAYNERWKTFVPTIMLQPPFMRIEKPAYISFRDDFIKALKFKEREEWYWEPVDSYVSHIDQATFERIQKNI